MDKVATEANSKQKEIGETMKKFYNSFQQWATMPWVFAHVTWFWVAFHIQAMFHFYKISLDFLTLSILSQENATISNMNS